MSQLCFNVLEGLPQELVVRPHDVVGTLPADGDHCVQEQRAEGILRQVSGRVLEESLAKPHFGQTPQSFYTKAQSKCQSPHSRPCLKTFAIVGTDPFHTAFGLN